MCLFLNVPYEEKDEARKLGAKWNPTVKKWYIKPSYPCNDLYIKFSKWILKNSDETFIADEYIGIIEGIQKCWKCGKLTRVIGLGVEDGYFIYGEIDDPQCEEVTGELPELHLAWVDNEHDIPPKLLRYLKEQYSVKTDYSKTLGEKCFSNYCDHCGALQGDWFLFDESKSPLSSCVEGNKLIERMRKLKIYEIPIDESLQLDWNIEFGSNDYAYLKYGTCQELVLSTNPDNEYISYKELYDI